MKQITKIMTSKTNSKRILVAEDDAFIGKILKSSLTDAGYQVDLAVDGAIALENMEKNEYDIVLLDLIMPNRDGFEVLNELKKMGNKTPVLIFTNLAQEEDKKEVMALGAKGYYIKSNMAISALLEVIKRFI